MLCWSYATTRPCETPILQKYLFIGRFVEVGEFSKQHTNGVGTQFSIQLNILLPSRTLIEITAGICSVEKENQTEWFDTDVRKCSGTKALNSEHFESTLRNYSAAKSLEGWASATSIKMTTSGYILVHIDVIAKIGPTALTRTRKKVAHEKIHTLNFPKHSKTLSNS